MRACLQPENLLIDVDGYVKMTDFGFVKRVWKVGGSCCVWKLG